MFKRRKLIPSPNKYVIKDFFQHKVLNQPPVNKYIPIESILLQHDFCFKVPGRWINYVLNISKQISLNFINLETITLAIV